MAVTVLLLLALAATAHGQSHIETDLQIYPQNGSTFGGTPVIVSGANLTAILDDYNVTCAFNDVQSMGYVINATTVACISPQVELRMKVTLSITVNGPNVMITGTIEFYFSTSILAVLDLLAKYRTLPDIIRRNICCKWAKKQNIAETNRIAAVLPPCPCEKSQIMQSKDFQLENTSSFIRNIFHPNSTCCYRERVLRESERKAGQQCCYDSSGHLLVGPPGGGTIDFVSPNVSVAKHFIYDVLPYLFCCPQMCDKYYKFRPSDNGSRSKDQGRY
jgi:hypothetical protein